MAGTYPGMIISAAQRQAAWLHKSALAVAAGMLLSSLLDSGFPRLHFSRKPNVETALRNFSAARLLDHTYAISRSALFWIAKFVVIYRLGRLHSQRCR